MQEEIRTAVRLAMSGSHKLRLVFKPEAFKGIGCLLGMGLMRCIVLNFGDETRLLAITQSNHWPENGHRSICITLTDRFSAEWFVARMEDALEEIEAVA